MPMDAASGCMSRRSRRAAASAAPGTIVSIGGDGMKIALAGGIVTIKRARMEPDGKKVAPAELASSGAIREGMRLS